MTELPSKCYAAKENKGSFTVFNLYADRAKKWDVVIIDLADSPLHYHNIGVEYFVVLGGELNIEVGSKIYHCLRAGHIVQIPHGVRHRLWSNAKQQVRLLCVNLPAFDPQNFIEVGE